MITPRTHRLLDHLAVAVFAAAPFALRLDGTAAVTCYSLAVVHLALTVLTRFPVRSADARPVPLTAHGAIEAAVAVFLVITPWVVPGFGTVAAVFLAVMGVAILVAWRLTPYEPGDDAAAAGPAPGEPRDPEPPPRP